MTFLRRLLPLYLFLFGLGFGLPAQIVWTEPEFPTVDDQVQLYYDATQGTAGLMNCNCDVYLHTGVITSESSNPGDWKHVVTTWGVADPAWKMTRVAGEANLYTYTIGPSIREFYGIQPGEEVEKLAFVFRNADGSLEGKDVGGADIFYPVVSGNAFAINVLSPAQPFQVLFQGEGLSIEVSASQSATFRVFDNGSLLHQTQGTSFAYELSAGALGAHEVRIEADNGSTTLTHTFEYFSARPVQTQALPPGVEWGLNFEGDTALTLALLAPNKRHVFLLSDLTDFAIDNDFLLHRTPDGQTWWIRIGGLQPGDFFRFQYLVDGTLRIGDPYSPLILDPFNDPWIPDLTFPDLPPYPSGKTEGIVSLVQPGAPEYDWAVENFQRPPKERLVIYELLVRDFIHRHDYPTLIDTLDYFSRLGINAIELMPVNEFEGNESWGYNPSYHMALDKYYGTPNEFKRFVDSCHARGIAVILDVVFNHAFSQNPLVQLYFDGKPTPENPWLNREAKHPFNVGFDFNHESPFTRFYVKKILRYWLTEFKVDGFRFDLSKGFTQRNTPNDVNAWSQYDASRIAILEDYAQEVWNTAPGAYVILEHFAVNSEETELVEKGMMVWGNMNYHYNEATMGWPQNDLSGAAYTSRGWDIPALIAYMESHDEERLMFKNLQYGNSAGTYDVKDFNTALRRVELGSVFFYPIPGPKMLWQFGELGYDFSIDFNCRVCNKPIRWDYLQHPNRRRLLAVTAALIHLRNRYELFHTTDFELDIGTGYLKSIHLNSPQMNAAIIGNFDVVPHTASLDFQHDGTWYEYFSGESFTVFNGNETFTLAPGEYRLYTDQPLDPPPLVISSTTEAEAPHFQWSIGPNPASNGNLTLHLLLDEGASVRLELLTLDGKILTQTSSSLLPPGTHHQSFQTGNLSSGTYLVRLSVGEQSVTQKIIIR